MPCVDPASSRAILIDRVTTNGRTVEQQAHFEDSEYWERCAAAAYGSENVEKAQRIAARHRRLAGVQSVVALLFALALPVDAQDCMPTTDVLALLGAAGHQLAECQADRTDCADAVDFEDVVIPAEADYEAEPGATVAERVSSLAASAAIQALHAGELRGYCDETRQYLPGLTLEFVQSHADLVADGHSFYVASLNDCYRFLVDQAAKCRLTRQHSTRPGSATGGGPDYSLQSGGHPAGTICRRSQEFWPEFNVLDALWEQKKAERPGAEAVEGEGVKGADLEYVEISLLSVLAALDALDMPPEQKRWWLLDVIAEADAQDP